MTFAISVLKETQPGEKRVGLTPAVTARLKRLAADIGIEAGAGQAAFFADPAYQGSRIVSDTQKVFINHPTMVKADLPFGGIRHSGYGRELIGLGITGFVNHKLIDVVDINAPF